MQIWLLTEKQSCWDLLRRHTLPIRWWSSSRGWQRLPESSTRVLWFLQPPLAGLSETMYFFQSFSTLAVLRSTFRSPMGFTSSSDPVEKGLRFFFNFVFAFGCAACCIVNCVCGARRKLWLCQIKNCSDAKKLRLKQWFSNVFNSVWCFYVVFPLFFYEL